MHHFNKCNPLNAAVTLTHTVKVVLDPSINPQPTSSFTPIGCDHQRTSSCLPVFLSFLSSCLLVFLSSFLIDFLSSCQT